MIGVFKINMVVKKIHEYWVCPYDMVEEVKGFVASAWVQIPHGAIWTPFCSKHEWVSDIE